MRQMVLLLVLVLTLSACQAPENREGAISAAETQEPAETSRRVVGEPAEESVSEDSEPEEEEKRGEPGIFQPLEAEDGLEGWTAYRAPWGEKDAPCLPYYGGELEPHVNVFHDMGKGSSGNPKILTVGVLDTTDPERPVWRGLRRLEGSRITVKPGAILCQNDQALTMEILDSDLQTIRTIPLPAHDQEDAPIYQLNDDYTMAAFSQGKPFDFENNTIVVASLEDPAARMEYSAYVGFETRSGGVRHSGLIDPALWGTATSCSQRSLCLNRWCPTACST